MKMTQMRTAQHQKLKLKQKNKLLIITKYKSDGKNSYIQIFICLLKVNNGINFQKNEIYQYLVKHWPVLRDLFSMLFGIGLVVFLLFFFDQHQQFQTIITTMQPTFQACVKMLTTFYQKVVKQHTEKSKLTANLNAIISQIQSKKDLDYRLSRLKRRKSDLSVSQRSHSRKVKQTGKKQEKEENKKYESLMSNQNFGTVLAFAYIYLIVDAENKEIFKMIETKTKLLYFNEQRQKEKDNIKWQHNIMEWKKICFMFQNKNTVKWDKILINAFSSFENTFVEIILRSILNLNVNTKIELEPVQKTLQKICSILKISIFYYKIEEDNIKQKNKFGSYKNSIIIGERKIANHKTYHCYDKILDEEQEPQTPQTPIKYESSFLMPLYSNKQIQLKSETYSSQDKSQKLKKSKSYKIIENTQEPASIVTSQNSDKKVKKNGNEKIVKKKCLLTVQFLLKEYHTDSVKLSDLECFKNEKQVKLKVRGRGALESKMSLRDVNNH